MPQTAIAQALAMPLGSVKGQVRRAQHQLRVCLEERTPRDGIAFWPAPVTCKACSGGHLKPLGTPLSSEQSDRPAPRACARRRAWRRAQPAHSRRSR
ncbi:hypothetical protein [Mitsuaria sp. CC2]|uniref:hypothetical protein n=1 Tax=Mitsuaria sp. CC2 TaxID=3029186 RepID=UPI003B9F398B